jgi:4-hydroxy-3-methylbut-2-enyl diphosphate reductase
VTAGASAPENLVEDLVASLKERGYGDVEEVTLKDEDVRFSLPAELEPYASKLVSIAQT